MTSSDTSGLLDIRVPYTTGCPNTPPTISLIKTVAAEMGISIRLQAILITDETLGQAKKFKMLGSPTVQVNGLDIDPDARGSMSYGFT